ncbi:hypothetical protein L6164_028046 [Bauhinia variegata]|uniref:Uncharacterized protein n=1 Tax=Bauhinia variegata TaxID=167791 RepID=A0ACB9LVT8_BAUVA|nr:hypothetical protein L6164_028046 [Bauhinia variegata]
MSNITRHSSLSTTQISIFISSLLSLLELAILMDSISNLQSFNSRSKVLNSPPSEPPDIGNWFSSYEYNTPSPDSNVNLEDSAPRGCEFKKDEASEAGEANFKKLVADEKLIESNTDSEQDKHEDGFLIKSVDSFSSHSLLSEPPDIRNWLSSYVYESFVPDTISLYGDSATKETESEGEGSILEEEIEDEVRYEAIQPRGSSEQDISSPRKDLKVKQPPSRVTGTLEMFALRIGNWNYDKILHPCLHESTLQRDNSPTKSKYEETLSLNLANPECNQEATLLSADINTRCSDNKCIRSPELMRVEDIRETRSNAKMQHDNLDTGVNLANRDKENEEDMKLKNGFVSTRKNRCYLANDQNSSKRSQEMLSKDSSKHAVVKRKALAEATNYQQSNAKEVTGKWQCPQKGKPGTGPSLKQLRLERWLHRA